uniref:ATP synthase F0 subunit 8 n=1 Tax=Amphioctopus fangsiao TaxID=515817 RepID=Q2ABH2_AMPFA|nr:ATP synthase F0 subunit 8 [Amphioctopus fangsiao etchuanus]YP_514811.1 ATP synthase F0 subunit 8 [Amphioctopus fangsiao]AWX90644.1 ATP synthase F0 subunit 8 [Amphioctopus fangsiao]AWX90656.1 ATP synthase F0 subunit 8 [Amphioctopus fangsiao]AWX90667.1 ATP synthase F0 subunit 8 [Amphioctopus fangsiao]AWX90679.1 ATP synthase F0 subunit 8 [Amphioctopus fangsiao]AWX90691.1 ATP synthase F0 subunit 8 [Amphioctopus fangsiao]
MPQLSPLNWIMLFLLFWFLLFLNSSIMWWNNKNKYILMNQKPVKKKLKYNW